jgi:hypothetical protein
MPKPKNSNFVGKKYKKNENALAGIQIHTVHAVYTIPLADLLKAFEKNTY